MKKIKLKKAIGTAKANDIIFPEVLDEQIFIPETRSPDFAVFEGIRISPDDFEVVDE